MNTKHTLGPLHMRMRHYGISDMGTPTVGSDAVGVLCTMNLSGAYDGNAGIERAKADARLFAAASDLLATLQNFATWHANHFEDFSSEVNAQLLCLSNDALTAIARATGDA